MAALLANPWLWRSLGAVLMALELLLPGLYLLWARLGALVVGLLLALFPDLPVPTQLLLFALTMPSVCSRRAKRALAPQTSPTGTSASRRSMSGSGCWRRSQSGIGSGASSQADGMVSLRRPAQNGRENASPPP